MITRFFSIKPVIINEVFVFFISIRVKSKRRFVGPNSGFISQLKIFYKMGYTIDPNNLKFKQYRLRQAADCMKKAKYLPLMYMNLIKHDPALEQTMPEPIAYRCRKCRRVVAAHSNLVLHKSKEIAENDPKAHVVIDNLAIKFREHSINGSDTSKKSSEKDDEYCKKMYFVEPLAWMKDVTSSTQGRLSCPKCQSKLGNFSWVMGCQCPCGQQVSPAFYLVPSRVEYSTVVQNVQVTV